MKRISKYLCAALLLFTAISCEKDNTWPDGDPALEHIYYVSVLKNYNLSTDRLEYEIDADGVARRRYVSTAAPTTAAWEYSGEKMISNLIPIRFISERERSYDVITYFWIDETGLKAGSDYSVLDESGTALTPNAQGAYSLTWQEAKKGMQNLKIRRLSNNSGSIRLNMLDRSRFVNNNYDRNNLETLINNQTNDYLVRGLYFDYNTLTITFR